MLTKTLKNGMFFNHLITKLVLCIKSKKIILIIFTPLIINNKNNRGLDVIIDNI